MKKKAKIIQIYKVKNFYIYHLVKANTNSSMKLKAITSSSCSCNTDFINNTSNNYYNTTNFKSKKEKRDVQLLLLPLGTNLMQPIPLYYNFYKKKSKIRLVIYNKQALYALFANIKYQF